jgi:hypothetical protein
VIEVFLSGGVAAGRVALIDDADEDLIAGYSWYCWEEKRKVRMHGPYALAYMKKETGGWTIVRMHKLLTGWPRTDHIDSNGLNNQRSNLRPATAQQNQFNRRPVSGTTSQYKGVSWRKDRKRWQAVLIVGGRRISLGCFTDETEAARAVDEAARHHHGEYARLNFPD